MTKPTSATITPIITGQKEILALGVSIQNRSRKLDGDIQSWLVAAIAHVNEHGDIRPISEMFAGKLGKGIRSNAMKEYIETFSKAKWSEKTKSFQYSKDAAGDTPGAQSHVWTDFKPEPPYMAMDQVLMITQMIKKMSAADAAKGDIVSPDTVTKLTELLEYLAGETVTDGPIAATEATSPIVEVL